MTSPQPAHPQSGEIEKLNASIYEYALRIDLAAIGKAEPPEALHVLTQKASEAAGYAAAAGFTLDALAHELRRAAAKARVADYHGELAVETAIAAGLASPAPRANLHGDVIANVLDGVMPLRRASDIVAQPVDWLWPGRIGIGKLTLVAGVPGLGKSQFAAFLAAAVTGARSLPCGEGRAPQGSVIILSAEDDATDTMRPRLDAAGADPARVLIVSSVRREGARRSFNLQADLDLLELRIRAIADVRLIVIDPISSYLGRVDSHKNAEVRSVLEPLADMAARLRVAVCAVTHFSKGAAARAMDRVVGSIAFVAAARSAFMITRDPADADRRLLVTLKSNIAADGGGLAFRIRETMVGNIATSAIEWEPQPVAGTADAILAAAKDADAAKGARAEAEGFLKRLLKDGQLPVKDVRTAADAAGVAWNAVRRTQRELGVVVRRRSDGFGGSGRWTWALPGEEQGG